MTISKIIASGSLALAILGGAAALAPSPVHASAKPGKACLDGFRNPCQKKQRPPVWSPFRNPKCKTRVCLN